MHGPLDQVALDVVPRGQGRGPRVQPRLSTSASSPGSTGSRARCPCLTALNRLRSLPVGDRGPVLFWAFRRLASTRAAEVAVAEAFMMASPRRDVAQGGVRQLRGFRRSPVSSTSIIGRNPAIDASFSDFFGFLAECYRNGRRNRPVSSPRAPLDRRLSACSRNILVESETRAEPGRGTKFRRRQAAAYREGSNHRGTETQRNHREDRVSGQETGYGHPHLMVWNETRAVAPGDVSVPPFLSGPAIAGNDVVPWTRPPSCPSTDRSCLVPVSVSPCLCGSNVRVLSGESERRAAGPADVSPGR